MKKKDVNLDGLYDIYNGANLTEEHRTVMLLAMNELAELRRERKKHDQKIRFMDRALVKRAQVCMVLEKEMKRMRVRIDGILNYVEFIDKTRRVLPVEITDMILDNIEFWKKEIPEIHKKIVSPGWKSGRKRQGLGVLDLGAVGVPVLRDEEAEEQEKAREELARLGEPPYGSVKLYERDGEEEEYDPKEAVKLRELTRSFLD